MQNQINIMLEAFDNAVANTQAAINESFNGEHQDFVIEFNKMVGDRNKVVAMMNNDFVAGKIMLDALVVVMTKHKAAADKIREWHNQQLGKVFDRIADIFQKMVEEAVEPNDQSEHQPPQSAFMAPSTSTFH